MKKTLLTLAAVAALGMVADVHAMGERPAAATATTSTGAPVAAAEMNHRMNTLQTGMLSLETSKLALSRATNPMVKSFAQVEVDEQETIASVFKSMYPSAPDVTLNAENADKLAKLKAAATGKAFDSMYVMAQIDGHKKLLDVQNDYLSGTNNREEMNVAKLSRGQIREHIMILEAFQAHMK